MAGPILLQTPDFLNAQWLVRGPFSGKYLAGKDKEEGASAADPGKKRALDRCFSSSK